MKILLLFDIDELANCHREYVLSDELDKSLSKGDSVSFTFCHPKYGEVMIAEAWDGVAKAIAITGDKVL